MPYQLLADAVFTLGYSLFALLVAATWWRFPPVTEQSGKKTLS